MQETVYDKFLRMKDQVKEDFPDFDERDFYKKVSRLASWHYPKKRYKGMKLNSEEAKMYEWMITHKYNPDTIYKWYRVLGFSKDLQKQVKNNKLSFNEAKTYTKPFRRLTDLESELMYQIKKCVEHYIVR